MRHPFVTLAIHEMREALRDFGYHTYGDKGPQEVMDTVGLVRMLRGFTARLAGDILTELATTGWEMDATYLLACHLSGQLQDWDELYKHPDIEKFSN